MTLVYLSLGSNKGDKVNFIHQATSLIANSDNIKLVRASTLYESEPWGEKNQDWFVNACLEVKTTLSPQEFLAKMQNIEIKLGRTKDASTKKWSEREIDIDISTTTSGEGFEVKENVINLKETKSYINRCKF